MKKLVNEKVLVSLILMALVVFTIGTVSSQATSPIIAATTSGGNTAENAAASNTNTNGTVSIGASVGAANTANNTATNTNKTNTNTNTNKTNTSSYTNTNSVNKLPYAGANPSLIIVVIALAGSAVYAYKKVTDYIM